MAIYQYRPSKKAESIMMGVSQALKDIRPMAEERARQKAQEAQGNPADRPPGTGFMTERARAKEALRAEVSTYTGENVHKIPQTQQIAQDDRILRVAAYCRVSTEDADQLWSIELQKKNYREMIKANPKWRYVGTYVDDGFSGTNTDHRPAFKLLMKDAMAGKIDMIITKSVSRFARNLLDCIGWVRELKDKHDPPIAVFFEQEHLNTLDTTSNIILFVLAMVAEEESHMKSEAMLLSLEWRFSRGRFMTPALLGYDKVEIPDGLGGHKKVLMVNEDEAQTVRLMYYMLLNGSSLAEIAETLTDLGRETGLKKVCGRSSTRWTPSGVAAVMRNERHCGDVLARKTWTPNFHDHKSKRNNGKKNKYYQPGHHEAIVTRAQWNAAQRILNSHRFGHSGGYLPMMVIDHGALTGYVSINKSWAGYDAAEYYRVSSIAMGIAEGELETDLENEHLPEGGHKLIGTTDDNGVQRIARALTQEEIAIKAQIEGTASNDSSTESVPRIKEGFQVVSGGMFNHRHDPTVLFTPGSITFNTTCVSRLDTVKEENGKMLLTRHPYVEMLLNPVERMLAVRPCTEENPNAIRWINQKGKGCLVSAKAFCSILYEILGWDQDFSYRVPTIVRRKGSETILFFDLDNYIGKEIASRKKAEEDTVDGEISARVESDETRGIFFGADDDEPQPIEDTEEMERRLREMAEYERQNFGTPAFEHNSEFRLTAIDDDGEWDVMVPARKLGDDHRVDEREIEALQDEMLEAMAASEDEEKEGGSE